MRIIFRLILLTTIITAGYLFYIDFKIEAHWVLLIFTALLLSFWLPTFFLSRKTFYQGVYLAELVIYFTKEMLTATFMVIREVLTRKTHIKAGIIAMPLDLKDDLEITILASLISLTPGSLSIEIAEDKSLLFIHAMYIPDGDTDRIKSQIKNGFERRVHRIFN